MEGEKGNEGLSSGGDGERGVAERVRATVGWLAGELRTMMMMWVGR